MTTIVKRAAAVLAVAWLTSGAPLIAQQQPAKRIPSAKVSVVIERYQGEKKVASMPFTLWLTSHNGNMANGSVRVGVDVPIGSTTTTRGTTNGNSTQNAVTSATQYQNVGTQIDCYLQSTDQDGVFILQIRLSDSSIYDPGAASTTPGREGAAATRPSRFSDASAFRTFSFDNSVEVRDGQAAEFVNATDKISGEIVRVAATVSFQK